LQVRSGRGRDGQNMERVEIIKSQMKEEEETRDTVNYYHKGKYKNNIYYYQVKVTFFKLAWGVL